MKKVQTTKITVMIKTSLAKKIKKEAKQQKTTQKNIVEFALENYFNL